MDIATDAGTVRLSRASSTFSERVHAELLAIADMLVEKNRRYGNSALEPVRVFSKASPVEQPLVRVDDKLSRIRSMGTGAAPDEDTVRDLIGYLVLLRISQSGDRCGDDGSVRT